MEPVLCACVCVCVHYMFVQRVTITVVCSVHIELGLCNFGHHVLSTVNLWGQVMVL